MNTTEQNCWQFILLTSFGVLQISKNIPRLSKGDASALVCTYVYNVIVVTKNHEKMQLVTLKIVDLEFYAVLANFVSVRKNSEKSPTVQRLKNLSMNRKDRQLCNFCDFLNRQEKWQILQPRKQKIANLQLRTWVSPQNFKLKISNFAAARVSVTSMIRNKASK